MIKSWYENERNISGRKCPGDARLAGRATVSSVRIASTRVEPASDRRSAGPQPGAGKPDRASGRSARLRRVAETASERSAGQTQARATAAIVEDAEARGGSVWLHGRVVDKPTNCRCDR